MCCTADHDMIYLEPFKGVKEVKKYFDKVTSIVPGDLKFCVEDITDGDPRKVGVKWCAFMMLSHLPAPAAPEAAIRLIRLSCLSLAIARGSGA